jgi:hypothetical protein
MGGSASETAGVCIATDAQEPRCSRWPHGVCPLMPDRWRAVAR